MISEKRVYKELKNVIDPELNVNIVDLGLIYAVRINKERGKVDIKMTLTSPGCPLSFVFDAWVKESILKIKGVKNVTIDLVWEPAWSPDKISDEVKEQLGIL